MDIRTVGDEQAIHQRCPDLWLAGKMQMSIERQHVVSRQSILPFELPPRITQCTGIVERPFGTSVE